jgi:hypothetical protein
MKDISVQKVLDALRRLDISCQKNLVGSLSVGISIAEGLEIHLKMISG